MQKKSLFTEYCKEGFFCTFIPNRGMTFVQNVTMNRKATADYYKSGNSIGVCLVQLEPGESVTIEYDVQVRKGTQKTVRHDADEEQEVVDKMIQDNTITLTKKVLASGDNGSASAEDSTVKVPPKNAEIIEGNGVISMY